MIDLPLILALSAYYFAMFITPGPNNTMLTISGIKFGFKDRSEERRGGEEC